MVDQKTVKKVAELARITLSPQELKRMEKDFNEILKAFAILEKVKTDKVKPSFQPIEIKNVTRKDVVEASLSRKQALANTKNKEKGYFKGPRVI